MEYPHNYYKEEYSNFEWGIADNPFGFMLHEKCDKCKALDTRRKATKEEQKKFNQTWVEEICSSCKKEIYDKEFYFYNYMYYREWPFWERKNKNFYKKLYRKSEPLVDKYDYELIKENRQYDLESLIDYLRDEFDDTEDQVVFEEILKKLNYKDVKIPTRIYGSKLKDRQHDGAPEAGLLKVNMKTLELSKLHKQVLIKRIKNRYGDWSKKELQEENSGCLIDDMKIELERRKKK